MSVYGPSRRPKKPELNFDELMRNDRFELVCLWSELNVPKILEDENRSTTINKVTTDDESPGAKGLWILGMWKTRQKDKIQRT